MAIVKGLAAKKEVMLNDFSDVIALDDLDCKGRHPIMYCSIYCPKQIRIFPTKQEGHLAQILIS